MPFGTNIVYLKERMVKKLFKLEITGRVTKTIINKTAMDNIPTMSICWFAIMVSNQTRYRIH